MYVNSDVWKIMRNKQGNGQQIAKAAQEMSIVVEAISAGLAIGIIYSLAYNAAYKKAKRDLEHRDRIERFKKQRRYYAT